MKKKSLKNLLTISLATALLVGTLTGCGSAPAEEAGGVEPVTQETNQDSLPEAEEEQPTQVRQIKAAVIGTTNGYAYIDENGDLVGYNIDVLNAVFDQLPQYELSFETTEFQSIFTGIDSGIYQIGAQAFISNAERREKYIFTDAFGKYVFKIVTQADNTEIASWEDIGGRTTESIVGDGPVATIEAYNAEFTDNLVQLDYVESDDLVLDHLLDKKIDFFISSTTIVSLRAQEFGVLDQLQFVDFGQDAPDYFNSNQYFGFLIAKDDEQLAQDFNTELEKLIENGTIQELSEKWFGSSEFAVSIEEAQAFRDATE